ncbi:hypothetical protein EDD21DRAFT_364019 [Dissophora ornata]|nr:hypothetical protein BGZ58_007014 [Dissophora ornata]KAI8605301.1 hypothetical protein EDD21DRAFT_364019 [Dissophora ornata]
MATTELRIIIAGSGIGGLSAAIALELAGLDYTVIEQELTPNTTNGNDTLEKQTGSPTHTGGAVQVGPTALHFLHQLGIYEEIQKISKPVSGFSMNEHDMNYVGRIDLSTHRERYGYHTEVMTRSQLYALLLQRIPPKRIVSRKVLGMIQDQEKVTVRCSDGTTYEGDVLIAADGAFSNVRHTLYWTLDDKKQLPRADAVPMSVDLHIISGCTKPLDPTKYPVLLDAMSEIQSVQLPDKPYAIWFVPLLDNRIAWDITREVSKTGIRQGEATKVHHWRPEDVEEMLEAVKNFECPYGGRIGDLIDTTSPESMYFHMTEERYCETWYGGRTVLVGDACHKGFLQPVSEAIVDAVTLVNFLSNSSSESMDGLTSLFKDYKERRASTAKAAVEQCVLLRQVFTGKGRAASLKRNVVFNYMPEKVRNLLEDKRNEDRPQLWFLPQVTDRGIVKALPNLPLASMPSVANGTGPVADGPVKVSLEAVVNATMSAAGSAASSPRTSRASWSSFSRPAFSMPSAPTVSLFSSPSSAATKQNSSNRSSLKSPRESMSYVKDEQGFTATRVSDDAPSENTAAVSAATLSGPVTAIATAAIVDADIEVATEVVVSPTLAVSKAEDDDDSSDEEGEFVNCSSASDDEETTALDKDSAV